MLGQSKNKQMKMLFINIEDLMPKDHFLRKLLTKMDFSFIYEKVKHLYSENGRPSIDPVLLIKSLLIGYLYGIDSERRLEQEIKVNMAYKWFLGLEIDENPPDYSTMSQNRRRRFDGSNIFRDIFEEIVIKCYESGIVDGTTILTDSTHVKANASSNKFEHKEIQRGLKSYVAELDKLADEEIKKLSERNIKSNPQKASMRKPSLRRTSLTDPDSGDLNRPGKPLGFHYLSHATSDSKRGIIIDIEVTSGDVGDISVYPDRIKYIKKRFNFNIKEAAADSGYNRAIAHFLLSKDNINLYVPLIKEKIRYKSEITKNDMFYDKSHDYFICPNSQKLKYTNVERGVYGQVHKVYRTKPKECKDCNLHEKCIAPSKKHKTIIVNVLEPYIEKGKYLAGTKQFSKLTRLRQIITEGNHALQKEYHNLRRTRKRGISKVLEHCLFSAMALNLKRLVKYS